MEADKLSIEEDPNFLGWVSPEYLGTLEKIVNLIGEEMTNVYSNVDGWPER